MEHSWHKSLFVLFNAWWFDLSHGVAFCNLRKFQSIASISKCIFERHLTFKLVRGEFGFFISQWGNYFLGQCLLQRRGYGSAHHFRQLIYRFESKCVSISRTSPQQLSLILSAINICHQIFISSLFNSGIFQLLFSHSARFIFFVK